MKDDLMKMVKKKKIDTEFKTENIRWVITVPAIWEEPAKQFMREAAQEVRRICLKSHLNISFCDSFKHFFSFSKLWLERIVVTKMFVQYEKK